MRPTILLVLTFLLPFGALASQERGSSRVFLSFLGARPIGPDDFEDFWSWGKGVGVGLERPMAPDLSTHISLEYSRFPLDEAAVARAYSDFGVPIDVSGSPVQLLAIRFGIKASPRELEFWARPFLLVNTGFVWAFDPDLEVSGSADSGRIPFTPKGLNAVHALGAGMEMPVPGTRFAVSFDTRFLAELGGFDPIRYLPIRVTVSRTLR